MYRLVLCVLLLVLGIHVAAQTRPLTVGWEEVPPIQISDTGDRQGIDMEIARVVLKLAGYELEFVKLPWVRQVAMLERGELDIAMAASITDERKSFVDWSDTYRMESTVLWTLDGNVAKASSLRSLVGSKTRIGYLRGSTFPGEFQDLANDPRFQALLYPLTSMKSGLAMLRAHRLEYVIEDLSTFGFLLSTTPGERVVNAATVNQNELHFMVSKATLEREPLLVARLNSALKSAKKSKEINKILKKYGTPAP